jgi:hypothetical protein
MTRPGHSHRVGVTILRPLEYPGIDYGFRPRLAWDEKAILHALLENAQSAEERKTIVAYWEAGRLDALPDELARSKEAGGEQEIARLELAPFHPRDVLSVRARRTRGGVQYRITDGHETELTTSRESTGSPLTLRELIAFIDGSAEPAKLAGLGRVRSESYPKLEEHYRRFFEERNAR